MKELLEKKIIAGAFLDIDKVCTPITGEVEECVKLLDKYGGEVEYRLFDGSRIDILTAYDDRIVAIEVDWLEKWKEAFGQTALYAALAGCSPMVILLVKTNMKADMMRLLMMRATLVGRELNIPVVYEFVEE